jgi:hypothetical protein
MKLSKRRHRSRRTSKSKPHKFSMRTLERFFLNYGLGISGAVILILGLIYLVILNVGNGTIFNMIQSFLNPGPENVIAQNNQDFSFRSVFSLSSFSFPGVISLVLLYFPGFIPLIIICFLPKEKVILKNSLILIGFLWLTFVEGKVFLYNAFSNGYFFPDFYSAFNFFLVVQTVLILISAFNKNKFALILSVIFFFISIALITTYEKRLIPFCMVLIILQITIFLFSLKFKWKSPFLLTTLISVCYLAFYITRKIVLAENPQPVSFLLPTLLIWYLITVTWLGIFKPKFRKKNSSVLWDSLSYVCLFLVIGLIAAMAMISGIYSIFPQYSAYVILALIIIAIMNERYDYLKSKKTFYYLVCLSAAFLLPLFLVSQFFLLLAASLSVAFLIHVHLTHSRISLSLSKVLFLIMTILYLLEWGLNIIPSIIDLRNSREIFPFNLVLGTLLIASTSYFYVRLYSFILADHPHLHTRPRLISIMQEVILPLILCSSGFLILNYVLIIIFPGYLPGLPELAMLTYISIWLIFSINPSGSRSVLIIRLIISSLAIILYPAVIYSEINLTLNLFLEGNKMALIPFLMHYICFAFILLILFQANGFLVQLFHGNHKTRYLFNMMILILVTFFLLTEYDYFSLLWFDRLRDLPAKELLRSNKFVPDSIILLTVSISVLIYSLIRYSRFLRRVSLIMLILVILKLFILDLKILQGNTIVILLVSVGLILLGVAILIRRIRKKRKMIRPGTSSEVITRH